MSSVNEESRMPSDGARGRSVMPGEGGSAVQTPSPQDAGTYSAAAAAVDLRPVVSVSISGRRRRPRKLHLTNNAKMLLLACCLFSFITASQYVAAMVAHSLALAADCASMLADALSFLGNLLAECAPARHKVVLELLMSGVSLLLLGGFTLFFVLEALDNMDGDGSEG